MWVALDVGKWGGIGSEVKGAVNYVRLDSPSASTANYYANAGLGVIADIVGPYSSGGVASIDASAWAANAVALYKAAPRIVAIEILNEPGGSWFWGSGATSSTNAAAYARLLKTVHDAFVANFGSSRPRLLASYDGGRSHDTTWGQLVWAANPNVGSYIDGITMHPYGGTSDRSASALGARTNIANAHNATGLPVYVTEIGWPTAVGQSNTGDSFQWSEDAQADNIYNFIHWARGTGYLRAVTIFNYRDFGTNMWYGITRSNGTHKKSYEDLRRATLGLAQS
jgi:hypothetical protein